MLAALCGRGARADVTIQRVGERVCDRVPLELCEDAHAHRASGSEHAPHLAEPGQGVGEELQPELADDDPELARIEWQGERIALVPLEMQAAHCRKRARHLE